MAGKTVYTGDMIAALESKIDSLIAKIDAQTTELGSINDGVAQSVTALNVKAAAVDKVTINAAKITKGQPLVSNTGYPFASFKAICNGAITISGEIEAVVTGASRTATLCISNDNGATWTDLVTTSGAGAGTWTAQGSGNLSVTAGNIVVIGYKGNSTGSITSVSLSPGAKIKYDLLDIVNDGAFAAI